MTITLFTLAALGVITAYSLVIASKNPFDLSQLGLMSANHEIDVETPKQLLADELCVGNINRDVYEMMVAEKYDLPLH